MRSNHQKMIPHSYSAAMPNAGPSGRTSGSVPTLRSLTPLLVEQVDNYQPHEEYSAALAEDDRHDALLVVLDALIALDAIVPADQAHKLYPEFPSQSLILLLGSPNNTLAVLDIFQKAKANWNWLTAGNVLVKIRYPRFPAGFAFTLLNRFTEHMTVSVTQNPSSRYSR
jgi:hypothetical protein